MLALLLAGTGASAQERLPLAAAPDPPVIAILPGTVAEVVGKVAAAMADEGLVVVVRDTSEGVVRTSYVPGPPQQRGGPSPTTLLPEYSALAIVMSVGADSVRVALTYWRRLTDLNQTPRQAPQAFPMHACPSLSSGRGTPAQIADCRAIRTGLVRQLQRIAAKLAPAGVAHDGPGARRVPAEVPDDTARPQTRGASVHSWSEAPPGVTHSGARISSP